MTTKSNLVCEDVLAQAFTIYQSVIPQIVKVLFLRISAIHFILRVEMKAKITQNIAFFIHSFCLMVREFFARQNVEFWNGISEIIH